MNDVSTPPPARKRILQLDRFCAGFGTATVLKNVSLTVASTELFALIGPAGVGKSTLLRSLGRWNEQLPGFWARGSVRFRGKDLLTETDRDEASRHVALLSQKARLFTASVADNAVDLARTEVPLSLPAKRELARSVLEPWGLWQELAPLLGQPVISLSIARQRMLSMARLLGGGAQVLLLDEPFRDTAPEEVQDLINFVRRVHEQVSVVMVSHHQQRIRMLADSVCLLVDGRVVESGPADEFFESPATSLGARFIRDGNCWPTKPEDYLHVIPDEDVDHEHQDEEEESTMPTGASLEMINAAMPKGSFPHPGGFHWVIRGSLGGMQRPGLLREEEEDLRGLHALGAQYLVSLTEEPFPAERLAPYGVVGIHFPITDMGVPTLENALGLVSSINRRIDAGMPTILHCKAGLGRTGTLLACVLAYRGRSAVSAINEVRCVNPMYIQSEVQLEFVSKFATLAEKQRRRTERPAANG